MRTDKRKTMAALRKIAEAQGWHVVPTKNGHHLQWRSPGGTIVTSGTNECDWRAHLNHVARLRRHGLNI